MMVALTIGTNSSDIKLHNLSAILLTLLQHENVSRAYLAQALGVSSATISNLVTELSDAGYITEGDLVRIDGQVGRPQRVLRLVQDSRLAIGIHMDVDTSYISLCDLRGTVMDRESVPQCRDDDPEMVLAALVEAVDRLLVRHDFQREKIVGIGVGASGLVNAQTGTNVIAPNLHWQNVPIRDMLEAHLPYPVTVENNVRAMAFGEALFNASDTHALAFIYGRVGVGAGFVVGGQLFRGASAGAGEIGHTVFTITDLASQHIAKLESLVSEAAIMALATEIVPDAVSMEVILRAARDGHEALRQIFVERAFYLGLAIANLINIFNPERIVLGGIFRDAQDLMLKPIRETVAQYAFADLGQQVTIQPSTFGHDAGMIGAAALALDAFFYRPQLHGSLQRNSLR